MLSVENYSLSIYR